MALEKSRPSKPKKKLIEIPICYKSCCKKTTVAEKCRLRCSKFGCRDPRVSCGCKKTTKFDCLKRFESKKRKRCQTRTDETIQQEKEETNQLVDSIKQLKTTVEQKV